MVGGSTPWHSAKSVKIDSTAPAAPSMWPVMDFVALMGSVDARALKYRLDGHRFRGIAAGVDVAWALMWSTPSADMPASQSIGHTARCSSTVRAWRREMIRIAGAAVADNFAIDVRPTTTGMLVQFFQDKRTGPLSHDKTVTFTVKGAAGLLGDVVFGDSARILPKVLTASGVMTASVPPAIITSAAPRTIV